MYEGLNLKSFGIDLWHLKLHFSHHKKIHNSAQHLWENIFPTVLQYTYCPKSKDISRDSIREAQPLKINFHRKTCVRVLWAGWSLHEAVVSLSGPGGWNRKEALSQVRKVRSHGPCKDAVMVISSTDLVQGSESWRTAELLPGCLPTPRGPQVHTGKGTARPRWTLLVRWDPHCAYCFISRSQISCKISLMIHTDVKYSGKTMLKNMILL